MKILGPYFSHPRKMGEIDSSLHTELNNLFDKIVPGSTIRGAMYMWSGSNFRLRKKDPKGALPSDLTDNFLNRAKEADTKIIFDNYCLVKSPWTLQRFFNTFGCKNIIVDNRVGPNDPEVRKMNVLTKSAAKIGYMHDKFFLFSELKGIGKHVILQTSANINDTQYFQYNSAIVIYDDEDLFNQYLEHWDNVKYGIDCRIDEELDADVRKEMVAMNEGSRYDSSQLFFSPRSGCPLTRELSHLIKQDELSEIYIAMSFMSRPKIHSSLIKLKEKGCKIKIITSKETANNSLIEKLTHRKVNIPMVIIKTDDWINRMHHKFVLIRNSHQTTVWTGSYNLTRPALWLNDEALIRLESKALYRAYEKEFKTIWTRQTGQAKWF